MAEQDRREKWALVLGASSGFGAATAIALARDGYGIIGVHLDMRSSLAAVDEVRRTIEAAGVPAVFHNVNAADEAKRHAVIEDTTRRFAERREAGVEPFIAVFLHSLAFGVTLSYITTSPARKEVTQRQLEMTVDVMAHSMV